MRVVAFIIGYLAICAFANAQNNPAALTNFTDIKPETYYTANNRMGVASGTTVNNVANTGWSVTVIATGKVMVKSVTGALSAKGGTDIALDCGRMFYTANDNTKTVTEVRLKTTNGSAFKLNSIAVASNNFGVTTPNYTIAMSAYKAGVLVPNSKQTGAALQVNNSYQTFTPTGNLYNDIDEIRFNTTATAGAVGAIFLDEINIGTAIPACTTVYTNFTPTLTNCPSSYTWVEKNKTYTTNNYSDTIMRKTTLGCDSIVTLNLTFATAPTVSVVTPAACAAAISAVTLTTSCDATQVQWKLNGNVVNTTNSFTTIPSTTGNTVAGDAGTANGTGQQYLSQPTGMFVDGAGNIYVADRDNQRIQKFPPNSASQTTGITVAGGNGQGSAANQFNLPKAVWVDALGNIYVVDEMNNRIQKFPPNSTAQTNGITVAGGNGRGAAANQLNQPNGFCFDAMGNMYVTDNNNRRVQKFPPNSTSKTNGTTIAGDNKMGTDGNYLLQPSSVCVDAAGNIYVADSYKNRVQKFPANSNLQTYGTTVAGDANGNPGYAANELWNPTGVCLDSNGNIYVADNYNHRVQKFPPNSTTQTNGITVAGSSLGGSINAGPNQNQLSNPNAVFIDRLGNIYVADKNNNRIQKWAQSQTASYTPTITGNLTAIVTNAAGCSATSNPAPISTTVNTTFTPIIERCEQTSYYWAEKNKTYYTNNNTDTIMRKTVLGCDSIVTLNLSFRYIPGTKTTQTACNSFAWNGTTYTASGTYYFEHHLMNTSGCKQKDTLVLTINKTANTTFTPTISGCRQTSYFWAEKNKTYYANNNTDTIMRKTVLGCDSIVTINLIFTFNPGTKTTQTVCNSYLWNGYNYTVSGTYYFIHKTTNANGCSPTDTLDLTINKNNKAIITAYGSYSWKGTMRESSGTYTYSYTTTNGCNITDTLVLTILPYTGCYKQVSAGCYYTLAIKNDGTLWAWGNNIYGQLGDKTNTNKNSAVQIGTDKNWTKVSAGYNHSLALKTNGTLWAWGNNTYGQLGDGTNTDQNSPVQVGTDNKWASMSIGKMEFWGSTIPFSIAIKTDGTLWAWGRNDMGDLGDGTTTNQNSPVQVGTDNNWASISVGFRSTVAIRKDGTLWTWGYDIGQLGLGVVATNKPTNPTQIGTANNWLSIAAGFAHTIALKCNSSLWAWGYNSSGQLGLGLATAVVKKSPTQNTSNQNWASISTGAGHTIGVKNDGTLWAWGNNSFGQLGNGTKDSYGEPKQIGTANNWASVSAGASHSLAIKKDGTLWAWGNNDSAQLGDGTTDSKKSPTSILCPISCPTANTTFTAPITRCEQTSYYWAEKNKTYYANNNTDTIMRKTVLGCDSIVTLNLSFMFQPGTKTVKTACSSFTWNGTTYTTSGTYYFEHHRRNNFGCQQKDTLVLTLANKNSSSSTNLSLCSSQLPYSWNGLSLTAAGNYVAHLTNAAGCDSAATVNVTVMPSPQNFIIYPNNLLGCAIGGIKTITTNTWGTSWTSSDPSVASVTFPIASGTNGVAVKSLTNGTTTLIAKVTGTNGCATTQTVQFKVDTVATALVSGATNLVAGATTQLTANIAGGTWGTTSHLVSVNNQGLVTANNTKVTTATPAIVTYTLTNSSGCKGVTSKALSINPKP